MGPGQVHSSTACLLPCDLEDFAAEVFESFARADQRSWGKVYPRGLLVYGRRKSVEPMAARPGEDGNRQTLAHFSPSTCMRTRLHDRSDPRERLRGERTEVRIPQTRLTSRVLSLQGPGNPI
ncbi:hypothetical protein GCM10011578_050500 [Streptomyces fuscichromogenes]|uniref:Transposase IS701-like DDE domain-containing protein n=1 Tax=Streptomyces fuscichromogenes TaxID=1324013 RepID=A0A917XFG6_9ACTN|nr:hypothetical protein GCM10011578_050500 [Streptomyces fuscichromogenes]